VTFFIEFSSITTTKSDVTSISPLYKARK
jgi:hypothetical protein